ncbi:hypothetical protein FGO68_gene6693 [Halteria grandinella]|uniref:Uncharacterized protein n=1 Tax=Halteria grandinella TaxID=5974 RepID=A0A8J8P1G0_HALGN|nr:hypothetical protein FGO68_gene6693 [Halteria grandinella]
MEAAFEVENLQIMRFLKSKKVGRLFVKKLADLAKNHPRKIQDLDLSGSDSLSAFAIDLCASLKSKSDSGLNV